VDAQGFEFHYLYLKTLRLGIGTPWATEGAPFKEDNRPDTPSVMNAVALDVKYQRFHMITS